MLFVIVIFQIRAKWAKEGLYKYLQMMLSATEGRPLTEKITSRGRELESRFQAIPIPNSQFLSVKYIDPTGTEVPVVIRDSDPDQPGPSHHAKSKRKRKRRRRREPPPEPVDVSVVEDSEASEGIVKMPR